MQIQQTYYIIIDQSMGFVVKVDNFAAEHYAWRKAIWRKAFDGLSATAEFLVIFRTMLPTPASSWYMPGMWKLKRDMPIV